jgi:hypothetical protein
LPGFPASIADLTGTPSRTAQRSILGGTAAGILPRFPANCLRTHPSLRHHQPRNPVLASISAKTNVSKTANSAPFPGGPTND